MAVPLVSVDPYVIVKRLKQYAATFLPLEHDDPAVPRIHVRALYLIDTVTADADLQYTGQILTRVINSLVRGLMLNKHAQPPANGFNAAPIKARVALLEQLTENEELLKMANSVIDLQYHIDVGQAIACIDALCDLAIYLPGAKFSESDTTPSTLPSSTHDVCFVQM